MDYTVKNQWNKKICTKYWENQVWFSENMNINDKPLENQSKRKEKTQVGSIREKKFIKSTAYPNGFKKLKNLNSLIFSI